MTKLEPVNKAFEQELDEIQHGIDRKRTELGLSEKTDAQQWVAATPVARRLIDRLKKGKK